MTTGSDDLLQRWSELEERFSADSYAGSSDDDVIYRFDQSPTVVTAPHAVRHTRNGREKDEDLRTGGLALLLAQERALGYACVGRLLPCDDANSSNDHPIKSAISAALDSPDGLATVIDLHGMSDDHGVDISIGLGRSELPINRRLGEVFAAELTNAGMTVDLGAEITGFRARGRSTLTSWAQHRGLAAIQIEIASRLRFRSRPQPPRLLLVEGLLAALDSADAEGLLSS